MQSWVTKMLRIVKFWQYWKTFCMFEQNQSTLLLVDDDEKLTQLLQQYFTNEGFDVIVFASGDALLGASSNIKNADMIILDVMMPGLNGLDTLQRLRQISQTPVIMLTGKGDDYDRIVGLEIGADDYIAKPCNPREILARIKAIFRRTRKPATLAQTDLSFGQLQLNFAKRLLTWQDQVVDTTPTEFSALAILMQHAGTPVSREALTEKVLHRKLTAYDRSIDVHISRLRHKLAQFIDEPIIKTIRSQGYQFTFGTV